ncbi:hypothetical protein B0A48_11651 [Cryoendolithus antarcticus]|uniref:Zn(2)-C6 fungal-type domain-containing protein n=1 Tax=Cryoendolithus antarcticus TaxID=1507870 RepID=A0A1V8SSR1_9PEZI|nr:hypothetical protein B0A48_11651 [Cryoendolithus antarcticus]
MGSIDPQLGPDGDADMEAMKQIPPISQAVPAQGGPAMQTLQPQHPDAYRALPPPHMYGPPYAQPPMGYPQQPAPRQRTAIACRYCRRRKIRCSGFDHSEDGRCTNCQRFQQECVFTPVSAQTQAFVPAHTVYRGQLPPPNTQLYGAYGQPLPANGRDPYGPPPGQYGPPPPGYQHPAMYQPQPGQPQGAPQGEAGRKRGSDEPHTPTLPPPPPGQMQRGSADGSQQYNYPDPMGLPAGAFPASSTVSYYPAPPQAFYGVQPTHYASPIAHSFEGPRDSTSPHAYMLAPTSNGTSDPSSGHRRGTSTSTSESAGEGKREERTSTDSGMVDALNRKDDDSSVMSLDGRQPRMGEMVDVGVQTEDLPPMKESA